MASALAFAAGPAAAQTAAKLWIPFTKKTTLVVPSNYQFRYSLWTAPAAGAGTEVWSEQTVTKRITSATVTQNLGSINSLASPVGYPPVPFRYQLWVQMEYRTGSTGPFTVIGARTQLNAAPYALWADEVAWESVTAAHLSAQGAAEGQVLQNVGGQVQWIDLPPGGGGGVTSVNQGTGISVSPTSGDVTVGLDTTYTDDRYLNAAGDVVNGFLTINSGSGPDLMLGEASIFGGSSLNLIPNSATGASTVTIVNQDTTYAANLSVEGSVTAGGAGFIGPGGSLTGLNAGNLASGAVSPARGGTGRDTSAAAAGSLLVTTAAGTWNTLGPGTANKVLKISGGAPAWLDDTDTTYSAGTGLQLSGTQFSAKLGTAATDVAAGNHAHDTTYWRLGGNAGTTPGTHYLGTSDNQALELRANGVRALRLEPTWYSPNVTAGSQTNQVTAGVVGATIGGGGGNVATSENRVTDDLGTVGGGEGNQAGNAQGTTADASGATVGGGSQNLATGAVATVAGGFGNLASGYYATVAGGDSNAAVAEGATVGGGTGNLSSMIGATVPGGTLNQAGGEYSFAAGHRAKVRDVAAAGSLGDEGTFVWADSQEADFVSSGPNQFLIRAGGGVGINTSSPAGGAALDVAGNVRTSGTLGFGTATRQLMDFYGAGFGLGVQDRTVYQRTEMQYAWYKGGIHSNTAFAPGSGGEVLMELHPAGTPDTPPAVTGILRAQTVTSTSDRAAKEAFEPVDVGEVLARLVALPVTRWKYRNEEASVRHLGPVAQDFRAAFAIGYDETSIAAIDADGVAFAAIQGLNAKVDAQRTEIETLKEQLAEQRALVLRLLATVGAGAGAAAVAAR